MEESSPPASRTRGRKGSDRSNKTKMEDQSQNPNQSYIDVEHRNHQKDKEVSAIIDSNYVKEVLYNPPQISLVQEEVGEVLNKHVSVFDNLSEVQTDGSNKRKSVGQIVSDLENRTPIGSPMNSPKYKLGLKTNSSSTPKLRREQTYSSQQLFANNMSGIAGAVNRETNLPSARPKGNFSLNYGYGDDGESSQDEYGRINYLNKEEQEQQLRNWEDAGWNQPPQEINENGNPSLPPQEDWSTQDDSLSEDNEESESNGNEAESESSENDDEVQLKTSQGKPAVNSKNLQRNDEEDVIQQYKDRLLNQDPTVMFEMFELLLAKISQVQDKIDSIEDEVGKYKTSINKDVKKCKNDLTGLGEKVYDLIQVAVKIDAEVHSIKNKLHALEVRIQKGS